MNKSIIALVCAVLLGGFFVQGAEARHHHRWKNSCNNNSWHSNGRHNGWRNRGYRNSYLGYGNYNGNGWGNRYYNGYNGVGARVLNWR